MKFFSRGKLGENRAGGLSLLGGSNTTSGGRSPFNAELEKEGIWSSRKARFKLHSKPKTLCIRRRRRITEGAGRAAYHRQLVVREGEI